jgi:Leucine-rich repeat (LRR) protein
LLNLSLANNLLTQIPDYLFKNMESAKELYLQNNLISTISSNSLAGLIALQILNMTGNRLPLLPLGVFDAVGSLTTLLLANNAIRRIDQKPFQSQAQLVTLDMSNNNIENVTSDWFLTTQRLQVILLNRNQIRTINMTSMSSPLPSLVRLNLSDNLLTRVDSIFTNWQSLRSLDLSRNPLGLRNGGVGLSSSFSGMTSLTWLGLSGSCLTSFDGAVQLSNLQSLQLADNQLANVTVAMLSAVPSLQTLDLSNNNIVKIEPRAFASAPKLTQVNMSGNALTGDQLTAAGLTASATVDVSWNNIVSLAPIPRQDGGIYLRGNPLACVSCNSSQASSWWPADSRLLLDANQAACLQSTTNTPVLAVCSCSSSASVDCSVPLSLTQAQYLVGFSRTSRTCPYDVNILNPNRPRFANIQVSPTSPSSVDVTWNVTDPQNVAVSVSIAVGLSAVCFNASSTFGNLTDLNSVVYKFDYNINQTDCNVTGLTTSTIYAVCGQVLVPTSATSNSTTPSDTQCKCTQLPVVTTAATTTTTTTASVPPTPLPEIVLALLPGERTILVTWRVNGSTTGSSSLAQFDSFRLSCTAPSSGDTWSEIVYSNSSSINSSSSSSSDVVRDGETISATIRGLSLSTTYNVCVEAANGRVVQCQLTTTLSISSQPTTAGSSATTTGDMSPSSEASSLPPTAASSSKAKSNTLLIIVIVVPIGAFLIILLVILCIVCCCIARRRRRRRQLESQSQSKQQASVQQQQQQPPQPIPVPSITATTKLPEVTSYEDDMPDLSVINMSEQSLVSLSVYDLRNPI